MPRRRLLLWIAACASLLSANVSASDSKTYPGSNCVRFSGGAAAFDMSRLGNSSTSSAMLVDCPITKDGGSTLNAWVRVQDRHSTEAVECTLYDVVTDYGDSVTSWLADSDASAGSSANYQDLTYGSMSTTSDSYKFLGCRIPIKSGSNTSYIAAYYVNES